MIVLIDPVCTAWIHEEVNAGFLQLVRENSDEKIVYVGEEQNICCIKSIYDHSQIYFTKIAKIRDFKEADYYRNTRYYFKLLQQVIGEYQPDKLFVLCGYRPCLLAAEAAAFLYKKLRIYFVIHGMAEEKYGYKDSYERLFLLSRHCNNLRFITYSPYCTGEYWNLNKEKFIFLDHPYVEGGRNKPVQKNNRKIIIGVIGACANDKAVKIISMVNQCRIRKEYEFWIASKYGNTFRHLKNVRILENEFDRKQMNHQMRDMDYLLIPYGRNEYKLSASGVLWDAISNRIPCLMLDSRYFAYYISYKIGCQAENLNDLCRTVCRLIDNDNEGKEPFFVGLDEIADRRQKTIRLLLDEGTTG